MEGLRVTVEAVREAMERGVGVVPLDVRSPGAWAQSSDQAAGSIRLPLTDLGAHAGDLPHDQELVAYCT